MPPAAPRVTDSVERTLLFTDVVDSTLLVERLGDARARELWVEHDARARALLVRHHGHEVERTDGFFLLFDVVADAARFALDYHGALALLGITARVGVHIGSVTLRDNAADAVAHGAKPVEVEGLAKPFAARVVALAGGGQTLLSAAARQALHADAVEAAQLESHGHYRLKGIEEPIEIFELGVRDYSGFAPPADSEKAYRVVRTGEFWQPVREVRHNLPAERDTFVGRTVELRALAQRLDAGTRLLTVLGPGGTGKTRLVARYGRGWLGDWPGGVHFCDLSEAKSHDGVLSAVAVGLGVPLGAGDAVTQLGHVIAARGRCLVILDNFEQVAQHAAATLGHWLDRAADGAFVVTSRERLHLPGEEIFQVEPLRLDKEAIELFVVRARSQRPEFALTGSNRAQVAEVVRLLDGLPLAIELAAARTRVLSPGQLIDRMRDRFALLAGTRGAAARQATLRAAIDWSWELLTPWEQAALAQCSVFEGGFTLAAAEAVIGLSTWPEAPSALDVVQALVDKSLLRTWVHVEHLRLDIEEPYFAMYLSVREYATGRLAAHGSRMTEEAEQRHGAYFAGFGIEAALDALNRHGSDGRRRLLALELDNLVCACRRAVHRGDVQTAVATFRAASVVLDMRGPFALGVELGESVAELASGNRSLGAAALVALATALRRIGRLDEAQARLEQALAVCRQTGDRRGEGIVLGHLGAMYYGQGKPEELAYLQSALAIHRELADRVEEGIALGALGTLHCDRGQMDKAQANYEAALVIDREVGNRRSEALVLANLGTLFNDQGRLDEARVHYDAALVVAREIGSRREEGAIIGNLGALHFNQGRPNEARASIEAALAVARDIGDRRSEGIWLGNLGDLDRDQSLWPQALAKLEPALAIAREVGHKRHEGMLLGGLGDALARQGRHGEAREAFRDGEQLLREIDDPLDLVGLLCERGQAEVRSGETQAARATLAQAEALAAAAQVTLDADLFREIAKLRAALS